MAVSAYERVAAVTGLMSEAVYAALEAIDAYRDTVAAIADEQRQAMEPNAALVKRMDQFGKRADAMTATIEDQVLDHLNFCTDRLFSVDSAERGEAI